MKFLKTPNGNNFYIYDDRRYHNTFPIILAKHNKKHPNGLGSGPKECENCCFYGSINGVFVSYCLNCAPLYDNNSWIIPKDIKDDKDLAKIPFLKDGIKLSEIGFSK